MQSANSTLSILEHDKNEKKAAAVGAIARLIIGHPIETWATRQKVHHKPIYNFKLPFAENILQLRQTIYHDAADKGAIDKISSLYRGIGYASFNRGIQLGSLFYQRRLEKYLRYEKEMTPRESSVITALGLGSLTAALVAPFNQGKVSRQLKTPWVNPYASFTPTILRNTTWFLTKSTVASPLENFFLKNGIFGSKDQTESNETQKDVADFSGSCIGSLFSFPFDRLKNLIQGGKIPKGTMQGLRHIIEKEGIKALGRGAPPEILLQCVGYGMFYTTKNLFLKYEEEVVQHKP